MVCFVQNAKVKWKIMAVSCFGINDLTLKI
jgi:hypothetical protein